MITKRLFVLGSFALAGCAGAEDGTGSRGDEGVKAPKLAVIGTGKFNGMDGKTVKGSFDAVKTEDGAGSWIWLRKNFVTEDMDNLAVGLEAGKIGEKVSIAVKEVGPLLGADGPQGFNLEMAPADFAKFASVIIYSTSDGQILGSASIELTG